MLMVSPIQRRQTALIEVLRTMGDGWFSRGDIAAAMGKNRLNPSELDALDDLAIRGDIIERRLGEAAIPNVNQWQYRIKGGEDIADS